MKSFSWKVWILPVLALVGIVWAIYMVIMQTPDQSPTQAEIEPLASSLNNQDANMSVVAGTGLVESKSEDISIGTHKSGIIQKIYIKEGDHVKKGQPLFTIDNNSIISDIKLKTSQVKSAGVELEDKKTKLDFYEQVKNPAAITREELMSRKLAFEMAKCKLEEAKASLRFAQTDLYLHTVRAPIEGEILQVNVQVGEYASSNNESLILMGDTSELYVRINIDEFDIPKIYINPLASISPKGNGQFVVNGEFVRLKPFVVPKKTLSGNNNELVDTRVVQVIFKIMPDSGKDDKKFIPLPGQQVDAYITSDPSKELLIH